MAKKKSMGKGFTRIRVEVKIHEALIDGFQLPYEEKEMRWIHIKYEKLIDYCSACGKLGHVLKNCRFIPVEIRSWFKGGVNKDLRY